MLQKSAFALFACIVVFLVCACAPSTAERSAELLDKDYRTMSDQELETYYFRLNDQIARVERRSRDTRVGIGFGGSSVGVGASTAVGGGSDELEGLRDRRNAVRRELSRRGLRP